VIECGARHKNSDTVERERRRVASVVLQSCESQAGGVGLVRSAWCGAREELLDRVVPTDYFVLGWQRLLVPPP